MAQDLYELLNAERDRGEKELALAHETIEMLRERCASLEFELETLKERCEYSQQKYSETKQELSEIEIETRTTIKGLQQEVRNLEKNLTKLALEKEALHQRCHVMHQELDESRNQSESEISDLRMRHQLEAISLRSSVDKQERLTYRFKQELHQTVQTYDKVIEELKLELGKSQEEVVYWRVEVRKAALLR